MRGPTLLVDVRVAQTMRDRGIPRYLETLVATAATHAPHVRIAGLIDRERPRPDRLADIGLPFVNLEDGSLAGLGPISHYLEGWLFDRQKPVETLFPTVLRPHHPRLAAILYDLIPWIYPAAYLVDPARRRAYHRALDAVRWLDRVFCISESVVADAVAITGIDRARTTTLRGGIDEARWADLRAEAPGDRAKLPLDLEIADRPPLRIGTAPWTYVGGDDFRKNLGGVLAAAGVLKRDGGLRRPVVIACSMREPRRLELERDAAALGLEPGRDLIVTGFLEDGVLGRLIASSFATVFPSLYEGLGLPILESYQLGRPALGSDVASLRELVPEGCRFDPTDPASIAAAMWRFEADEQLRATSIAFGKSTLETWRWSHAAASLIEWVEGRSTMVHELASGGAGPDDAPERVWVVANLASVPELAAVPRPMTIFVEAEGSADLEAARAALARARFALGSTRPAPTLLPLSTLPLARAARPDTVTVRADDILPAAATAVPAS